MGNFEVSCRLTTDLKTHTLGVLIFLANMPELILIIVQLCQNFRDIPTPRGEFKSFIVRVMRMGSRKRRLSSSLSGIFPEKKWNLTFTSVDFSAI